MQQWVIEIRIVRGIDIRYLSIHPKLIFIINREEERQYIL